MKFWSRNNMDILDLVFIGIYVISALHEHGNGNAYNTKRYAYMQPRIQTTRNIRVHTYIY
jgi:hypothetical protein